MDDFIILLIVNEGRFMGVRGLRVPGELKIAKLIDLLLGSFTRGKIIDFRVRERLNKDFIDRFICFTWSKPHGLEKGRINICKL